MEIVLGFSSGNREARVSDLSLGGCFVDCILEVPEGETTTFELRLPTGKTLNMTGEIAYSMPGFGFGLRFTSATASQTAALEEAIKSHGGSPHAKSNDPADSL